MPKEGHCQIKYQFFPHTIKLFVIFFKIQIVLYNQHWQNLNFVIDVVFISLPKFLLVKFTLKLALMGCKKYIFAPFFGKRKMKKTVKIHIFKLSRISCEDPLYEQKMDFLFYIFFLTRRKKRLRLPLTVTFLCNQNLVRT